MYSCRLLSRMFPVERKENDRLLLIYSETSRTKKKRFSVMQLRHCILETNRWWLAFLLLHLCLTIRDFVLVLSLCTAVLTEHLFQHYRGVCTVGYGRICYEDVLLS